MGWIVWAYILNMTLFMRIRITDILENGYLFACFLIDICDGVTFSFFTTVCLGMDITCV